MKAFCGTIELLRMFAHVMKYLVVL